MPGPDASVKAPLPFFVVGEQSFKRDGSGVALGEEVQLRDRDTRQSGEGPFRGEDGQL